MFTLKAGDKVGIISPAGYINGIDDIKLPLEYLTSLGFECVLGKHIFNKKLYMAGEDKDRVADIHEFFKNPQIKAIFTTAGGCGSQRLLDLLDYKLIKSNPKPIFGLSDNTALQMGIFSQTNVPYVTGLSLKYDFKNGEINKKTSLSFENIISGKKQSISSGTTLCKGKQSGVIIGGCLSLIRSLCGTPYFPDLSEKILLLEDVGEKTYKIDLMLTQLRQQPNFAKIKGIIFGNFASCYEADKGDGNIDEILNDFIKHITIPIPIIKNFAYGHVQEKYVLPMGVNVHLDADNCMLKYL